MIGRRPAMDNTNGILDAWIMVEHLSEGEINLNDRNILLLDDLTDKRYKEYFHTLMENSEKKKYKSSGLVLYLDIFKFTELTDFLRKKF